MKAIARQSSLEDSSLHVVHGPHKRGFSDEGFAGPIPQSGSLFFQGARIGMGMGKGD